MDCLSFIDYFAVDRDNFIQKEYNLAHGLERMNCTVENVKPTSNKQLEHWYNIIVGIENRIGIIRNLINNYDRVSELLVDNSD